MAFSLEKRNRNSSQNESAKKKTDDREYFREYINILLLGTVFVVLISLLTYNPADPSAFNLTSLNSSIVQPTNTFGKFGSSLSDWGFQIFGLGALVFSSVFLIQLLNTFRIPKQSSRFLLRIFGYPQLIICYLGLLSLIKPSFYFRGIELFTGGALGDKIGRFCFVFLGYTGAFIVLGLGLIASLVLSLGIRPLWVLTWSLSKIPSIRIKRVLKVIQTEEVEEPEKEFIPQSSPPPSRMVEKYPKEEEMEEELPTVTVQSNPKNLVELLSSLQSKNAQKSSSEIDGQKLKMEAVAIEQKFLTFGISGVVQNSHMGPAVNIHDFEPAAGIKVNKVLSLQEDLALALKVENVSMSIQPGKNAVSIELPALAREVVSLREIMESSEFTNSNFLLGIALGKNSDGSPLVADLTSMPHLLVAGATGSGKSVCINTILLSLLLSRGPDQLKLILIDPKMLELSAYDGIGHLLMPVVTEPLQASKALRWAMEEMDRRYRLMKSCQTRNIVAYNTAYDQGELEGIPLGSSGKCVRLPYIVIVIDELCDLMMTSPKEVEELVQRLAQKARAAGIHMILATQRPSVDVLTGVIKANLPCRLSFQVASRHDSRTIIETTGAERLLGKGDMLFAPPGANRLIRAQCAYVTDEEIAQVSAALRQKYPVVFKEGPSTSPASRFF